MDCKRISTVLGIILILSCTIVLISNTKENMIHKKQIESKLNFSEEEKKSVNFRQLVEDIKAIEDGNNLKYAKKDSSETQNNEGGVKLVVYGNEYKGDGYLVRTSSVEDTMMYEFIKGEDCVYCISESTLEMSTENNNKFTKKSKSIIIYVIIGIMVVSEIIFICLYFRGRVKKNT